MVRFDYDIPYIAGYSVDGQTYYVDRMLPHVIGTIDILPTLLTHERVEKTLMDTQDMRYLDAHKIATVIEEDIVRKRHGEDGLALYRAFFRHWESVIREKPVFHVPPDLDRRPYRQLRDESILQRMT